MSNAMEQILKSRDKAEREAKLLSTKQIASLLEYHKTKTKVIYTLTIRGFKKAEIAKMLNIRYQHVYNVLAKALAYTPGDDCLGVDGVTLNGDGSTTYS